MVKGQVVCHGKGGKWAQHIHHSKEQHHQPAAAGPDFILPDKDGDDQGCQGQYDVKCQQSVSHGIRSAGPPEGNNRYRPDQKINANQQCLREFLPALYHIGAHFQMSHHSLIPLQQFIEADGIELAHLYHTADIRIGAAGIT